MQTAPSMALWLFFVIAPYAMMWLTSICVSIFNLPESLAYMSLAFSFFVPFFMLKYQLEFTWLRSFFYALTVLITVLVGEGIYETFNIPALRI